MREKLKEFWDDYGQEPPFLRFLVAVLVLLTSIAAFVVGVLVMVIVWNYPSILVAIMFFVGIPATIAWLAGRQKNV